MNPKLQQKISDLIRWSQQAFSDPIAEDIMSNSRKAGEALCKAIIFSYYGDFQGEQIILGRVKHTGHQQSSPRELDFSALISLVVKEDDRQYTIIQSKRVRHQIKAYLEIIRTHGNPGSHDSNDPEYKIDTNHVVVTRIALKNLLSWFFEKYLNTNIPHQIGLFISPSDETKEISLQYLSKYEQFKTEVKDWFEALNYKFTAHNIDVGEHFEWLIEEETRRGNIKILVYGLTGRINLQIINTVKDLVTYHQCDEGWIITNSVVEKVAREEISRQNKKIIYSYTFDELIEGTMDFSGYFEWLKNEVKSKNIDNFYVPLGCEYTELDARTNRFISNTKYAEEDGWIDRYVDTWLHDHQKEHLSILGEFGTGKTWFSLHYAWRMLKSYLQAKENKLPRTRIPLYIPLRDFSKALEVETLISDFFFRKHKIQIQGVFSAFNQLNKMGRLLLIFDGFDEMADKVDKQKMIDNFWQLATIINGKSKVILTCRNEHFPQIKDGRQLLKAELKLSTKNLTNIPPQFEIIQLLSFNINQIKKLLLFRTDEATVKRIMAHEELRELLSRPIMTELIFDALDDIEQGKPIDMSRVYLYAVKRKMERDIKQERTFTSLADKLYFLCELSWQMLSANKLVISYKEFSDTIRSLFGYIEDKEIDYWRYDLRGQSMLVIDEEDGNYRPAHKSLLEFFVAFKFASHLGILTDDFVGLARMQSHIDITLDSVDYTWESYFIREIDSNNKLILIPPLANFKYSNFKTLVTIFGQSLSTRAINDLILGMILCNETKTQERLWSIIELCRNKGFEEVGYLASNIVLLLLEYKHDFFKDKNLSNLCLQGLHFPAPGYKLTGYETRFSFLKCAHVSGTHFQNSDLRKVDFGHPFLGNTNFKNTNFRDALLDDFSFYPIQLDKILLIESARLAALASPNGVSLINIDELKLVKTIPAYEGQFNIFVSLDEKFLFLANYGYFNIFDTKNLSNIDKFNLSPQVNPNCSDPNNKWISCFASLPSSEILIIGCVNSFIYFFDLKNKKELNVVNSFTTVDKISVSRCENFFVSSGFNEFILWDVKTLNKVFFEEAPKQERLKKYIAEFHPFKNEFIVANQNIIHFFDISSMTYYCEFNFNEEGDISSNSEINCYSFSKDGNKIFIAIRKNIYIFDYHQKSVIKIIKFSDEQFSSCTQSITRTPLSDSEVRDMSVDAEEQNLYVIHDNRCVSKVRIDTGEIINIYLHISYVDKADFTGTKGLPTGLVEQLKKNNAVL